MTRAAQILLVLLTFAIGAPICVTAIGATFEHFAGQDGDQ